MPTYEYLCRQCGDRLDIWQSFSDAPLTRHEACGGSLRKVFHARGVVFKGSGFYVTDSRKPSPATQGANGKSASPSKEDASPASKPDADKRAAKSSESSTATSE